MSPILSIAIPTHNRESVIGRAIQSCLSSAPAAIEVIVVDSGSTDGTREVVRAFGDDRIRLICEERTRGVGPARNLAVENARADWILFLDSDNEFLPGAINRVLREVPDVPADIEHLRFCCRWGGADGPIIVTLKDEVWDYYGYLGFLQNVHSRREGSETVSCIRKRSFQAVRWADNRAFEAAYHIDFAYRFKTKTYADALMVYHVDANNRNSGELRRRELDLLAADNADSFENLLQRHGSALRRFAPAGYVNYLREAAKYHYLCGHRGRGTRRVCALIRSKPAVISNWILLLAGVAGPGVLGWVINLNRKCFLKQIRASSAEVADAPPIPA